jgi:hypothetical protein
MQLILVKADIASLILVLDTRLRVWEGRQLYVPGLAEKIIL